MTECYTLSFLNLWFLCCVWIQSDLAFCAALFLFLPRLCLLPRACWPPAGICILAAPFESTVQCKWTLLVSFLIASLNIPWVSLGLGTFQIQPHLVAVLPSRVILPLVGLGLLPKGGSVLLFSLFYKIQSFLAHPLFRPEWWHTFPIGNL